MVFCFDIFLFSVLIVIHGSDNTRTKKKTNSASSRSVSTSSPLFLPTRTMTNIRHIYLTTHNKQFNFNNQRKTQFYSNKPKSQTLFYNPMSRNIVYLYLNNTCIHNVKLKKYIKNRIHRQTF